MLLVSSVFLLVLNVRTKIRIFPDTAIPHRRLRHYLAAPTLRFGLFHTAFDTPDCHYTVICITENPSEMSTFVVRDSRFDIYRNKEQAAIELYKQWKYCTRTTI